MVWVTTQTASGILISRAESAPGNPVNVHHELLERLKDTRQKYEEKLKVQDLRVAKRIQTRALASRPAGRGLASIPQTSIDREIEKGDLELTELSQRTQILSEWIRKRVESREDLKRRLKQLDQEIQARTDNLDPPEGGASGGWDADSDRPLQKLRVEAQMIQELEAEFNKVQVP